MNDIIIEDIEKLKQTTSNLIIYNTNLPVAINKYFKIMRNDVDDMRDHLDRIDYDIDKKIISKQEMQKVKIRVSKLEDNFNLSKLKLLDLEDKIINIERDLMHLKTFECNEDLKNTIKILSDRLDTYNTKPIKKTKTEVNLNDKKLKSTIRNTEYSIKKLSLKLKDDSITDKEKIRLEEKNILLESLMKQVII